MKKNLIAASLCAAMCMSAFGGFAGTVQAEEADPITDIAGQYYSYYYYPSTDFLMDYYFHFYEEIEGVGQVYYAGFCLNQITYIGLYEVVEEETEYACWPDRETQEAAAEGEETPTGTAPHTIYFYDMDGNLVDSCGYDGTYLYMDMENISGTGGENAVYTLDTDTENSVMAADGTYATNEDLSEITLTSSDGEYDAVVTKNEDGTYTYTLTADGTEVILEEIIEETQTVAYSFVGQVAVPGMEDTYGDLVCDLYDDGTCRVYASAMGQEFDLDVGTYEIDMDTYTITIAFDNAGEVATYFTETTMAIDYVQAGADVFGDVEETLEMVQE
ncbi:MAG: hypothetical protein LIP11_05380 [Clostridiales bacterium]|nr:hypothetical protein [Clostridiales bacterium]